MIKKLFLVMLPVVLLFASCSAQDSFVGSANSNKYHYSWCKWAKKINPDNKVTFNSAAEAITAGYQPCKVCNPPGK